MTSARSTGSSTTSLKPRRCKMSSLFEPIPFASANTLDIAYSRKVLEYLIAHPDEHDQGEFGIRSGCRTTACVAGTAVLMDSQSTVQWSRNGEMNCVRV